MNKDIKYAVLQPLTGGFYLGCENAVGHPAEFIMSYPGLNDVKTDANGKIITTGNEYNLLKYLEKKGRTVPYYQFKRTMFQDDLDLNPIILQDGNEVEHPDYSDLDLVVAVPVCSGLSSATNQTDERKTTVNNNMLWLANYALKVIKPKIYIFENSYRILTNVANEIRPQIEQLAKEAGYSMIYYNTDSRLHENCQLRPRAFIYFIRNDGPGKTGTAPLNFEDKNITVEELLSKIPSDATQQNEFAALECRAHATLDYLPVMYGKDWRSKLKTAMVINEIIRNDKLDDWCEFCMTLPWMTERNKQSITGYVAHIKENLAKDKGFYQRSVTYNGDKCIRAAMFRNINSSIHYKEDRLYNIREWLTTMGMPYDFELYGDTSQDPTYAKIGQNVPVRTGQFICEEAVRLLNNWDTLDRDADTKILLIDNVHKKIKVLE